ncbi:AraC family transcriptional regulator [Arthrobacter sp. MYb227]|uniref:AraC-like ligand-binding domain-containing protein n=1 Tax=Arthrobacter sp. MYb227 TaxID=1848601 RepID=UPI000CFBEAD0|nr:helix-turn-helix domain-containing protein [Arthrobacter sp. MYb227]PQZ85755.1 AraC family transcriptional regulator [Arthrobacter sp. MYb227]
MYDVQRVESFGAWKSLVSESFVPLHCEQIRPGNFSGKIAGAQFGDVGVMEVAANAHLVRRTGDLLDAGDTPQFKLNLQLGGHGLLLQDGRETLLRPGDMAIYDTEKPYTLLFEEDSRTLVLMFPQHLLGLPAGDASEITAVGFGVENQLGAALSPFLTQLAHVFPRLEEPIGRRLASNVVDVLGTVLASELHERAGVLDGGKARHIRQIQDYIDRHLADSELSPGSIANAHFISLRSLHHLFAETGHTVSEWIRLRRLERCRRDLADPLQLRVPVGVIGARWGLPDAAHFSRVFRSFYGCSPTAFRLSI